MTTKDVELEQIKIDDGPVSRTSEIIKPTVVNVDTQGLGTFLGVFLPALQVRHFYLKLQKRKIKGGSKGTLK